MRHSHLQRATLMRVVWLAFAVILFATVLAIRVRLISIPLERDEGEYAYAGQLMLQGVPPYKLAYNMKFPGTYGAYALVMSIFGQTVVGIHLGLLLVNAAASALVFCLARCLIDSLAGIAAASSYAVLALSPSVLGLAAHATHFTVPPVLAGTLLLVGRPSHNAGRLFASGSLFGIAVLMKQPAVFFVLFAGGYLVVTQWRCGISFRNSLRSDLIFAGGVVLPFAVSCAALWATGVFDKFWFWTVHYARAYASIVPLSQAIGVFLQTFSRVIAAASPLWALAMAGVIAGIWDRRSREATVVMLWLLVCSFAAASAGLYFRLHYFVLLLPAVSLLIGIASSRLTDVLARYSPILEPVPLLLLGAAVSCALLRERGLFFKQSPVEACRTLYPASAFPESIRIADYVRERSGRADTIAVLGSEPQIYFYSKRHSATGYIYTYGLMEPHKYAQQMQAEMAHEIETARPKYLISVVMEDSWLARRGSNRHIFEWANEYTNRYYQVAGFVNIISPDRSEYYFDRVPESVSQLGNYILIYRRKF